MVLQIIKNYKSFLTLITLLLLSSSVFCQTKDQALRDAKITAEATVAGDFKTVLKHTYPPILEMMGGKTKAEELIEETFADMKTQGFSFDKAEVVNVSKIVNEQGQYRCYVQNNNEMRMGDTKIKSKSFLLGIYNEDEKFWYFLEAEKLKNKLMADKILPDFKTSLDIPDDEMVME